jgi:hypothetical protein
MISRGRLAGPIFMIRTLNVYWSLGASVNKGADAMGRLHAAIVASRRQIIEAVGEVERQTPNDFSLRP